MSISDISSTTTTSTTTSTSIKKQDETSGDEHVYLDLVKKILTEGEKKNNRTLVPTIQIFGVMSRYSLKDGRIPLLTTKKMFWRGIVEELLWIISGSTNTKVLQEKGVNIWNGNSSREFLDKRGLKGYEEGDIGPSYGFQWRHFGAEYKGMKEDYKGKGVDQLLLVINMLKSDPSSRRIVLNSWNASQINIIALPMCHVMCQFDVNERRELKCTMFQRSADVGLGVPFNIASYSLLTHMIAQICDLKATEFIHMIGDAHIYLNHIRPLQSQLKRKPSETFPIVNINKNKKSIDDFTFEDFELIGYTPHPPIEMKMNA